MPRYIDADKLSENIIEGCYTPVPRSWLLSLIKGEPTADVAEVKHGKWIAADEYMTDKCSMYGTHIQIEDFEKCSYNPKCGIVKLNYCPHCGAKMEAASEINNAKHTAEMV